MTVLSSITAVITSLYNLHESSLTVSKADLLQLAVYCTRKVTVRAPGRDLLDIVSILSVNLACMSLSIPRKKKTWRPVYLTISLSVPKR